MMARLILNPATRISYVALRVISMPKMVAWYQQVLGLAVLQASAKRTLLGVRTNRRVLVLLETGASQISTQVAGLTAFSLALPTRGALLKLAAGLPAAVLPVAWFRSGFGLGVRLTDPEGTQVILEHDAGVQAIPPRGYDFANAQTQPMLAPKLPKVAAERMLPAGAAVGRLEVTTSQFLATMGHIETVLGFVRQQDSGQRAYLTVGDNTHHIGIELVADAQARLRGPSDAGADYVSLVVPDVATLSLLRQNLIAKQWQNFDYNAEHQYLRVAGPNQLIMWFSVA